MRIYHNRPVVPVGFDDKAAGVEVEVVSMFEVAEFASTQLIVEIETHTHIVQGSLDHRMESNPNFDVG